MFLLDITTILVTAGLLNLGFPIFIRIAFTQFSDIRTVAVRWSVAGFLAGIGISTYFLRDTDYGWVSFYIGNSLLFFGLFWGSQALRAERSRHLSFDNLVIVTSLYCAAIILSHQTDQQIARGIITRFGLTFAPLLLAYEAGSLAYRSKSLGLWLVCLSNSTLSYSFIVQLINTLIDGDFSPLSQSRETLAPAIIGVATTIFNNVGFIGYLNEKQSQQAKELKKLATLKETQAQINDRLQELQSNLINRMDIAKTYHDLSQPVSTIDLNLQLGLRAVAKGRPYEPCFYSNVTEIEQAARTTLSMLHNLLHPAVFDTSDTEPPFEFNLWFHKEISRLESLYPEITIICQNTVPDSIQLLGNRTHHSRILHNLFNNAYEAMTDQPQSTVTLKAAIDNRFVRYSVADTGVGCEPDRLDTLGVAYETTKTEGTGLGLFNCRELIASLNGFLHFESQLNHGFKAVARLPVNQAKRDAE